MTMASRSACRQQQQQDDDLDLDLDWQDTMVLPPHFWQELDKDGSSSSSSSSHSSYNDNETNEWMPTTISLSSSTTCTSLPLVVVNLTRLCGFPPSNENEARQLEQQVIGALAQDEYDETNNDDTHNNTNKDDGLIRHFEERVQELFDTGVAHHCDTSTVPPDNNNNRLCLAVISYPPFLQKQRPGPPHNQDTDNEKVVVLLDTADEWKRLHCCCPHDVAVVKRLLQHLVACNQGLCWKVDMRKAILHLVRREEERLQRLLHYQAWRRTHHHNPYAVQLQLHQVKATLEYRLAVEMAKAQQEGMMVRQDEESSLQEASFSLLDKDEHNYEDGNSTNDATMTTIGTVNHGYAHDVVTAPDKMDAKDLWLDLDARSMASFGHHDDDDTDNNTDDEKEEQDGEHQDCDSDQHEQQHDGSDRGKIVEERNSDKDKDAPSLTSDACVASLPNHPHDDDDDDHDEHDERSSDDMSSSSSSSSSDERNSVGGMVVLKSKRCGERRAHPPSQTFDDNGQHKTHHLMENECGTMTKESSLSPKLLMVQAIIASLQARLRQVNDLLESLQEDQEWADEYKQEEIFPTNGGAGGAHQHDEQQQNHQARVLTGCTEIENVQQQQAQFSLLDGILAMILGSLPTPQQLQGGCDNHDDEQQAARDHYKFLKREHQEIVHEWKEHFGRLPVSWNEGEEEQHHENDFVHDDHNDALIIDQANQEFDVSSSPLAFPTKASPTIKSVAELRQSLGIVDNAQHENWEDAAADDDDSWNSSNQERTKATTFREAPPTSVQVKASSNPIVGLRPGGKVQ